MFGAPALAQGDLLHPALDPAKVGEMRVAGREGVFECKRTASGWVAGSPFRDRVDPRMALALASYAAGLRVEDSAPFDETDPKLLGLGKDGHEIRLEDGSRGELARFRVGRASAWKARLGEDGIVLPTSYVRMRGRQRRDHIYVCGGDPNPWFADGFRLFRDHHPFRFQPDDVERIELRSEAGELTLGRASTGSAWRIVKPLDLATDPMAVAKLLRGISELRADRVSDLAAGETADSQESPGMIRIGLSSFGASAPTWFEARPVASDAANGGKEYRATIGDRPGVLFCLPAVSVRGETPLPALPLTVAELRDSVPARLPVEMLRGISIEPSTLPRIVLTSRDGDDWMVAAGGGAPAPANRRNLARLLQAVGANRVSSFESDAATDLAPWHLDHPFLRLRFETADSRVLELRFGMGGDGSLFANRAGSLSVMRLDPAILSRIAMHGYEWRQELLGCVNRVNLVGLERAAGRGAARMMVYDFQQERWRLPGGGTLDEDLAEEMLAGLESLAAARWLAADDAGALAALADSDVTFRIRERVYDDDGEFTGFSDRFLELARAGSSGRGLCYGRLSSLGHPFLIDEERYLAVAIDPFRGVQDGGEGGPEQDPPE